MEKLLVYVNITLKALMLLIRRDLYNIPTVSQSVNLVRNPSTQLLRGRDEIMPSPLHIHAENELDGARARSFPLQLTGCHA